MLNGADGDEIQDDFNIAGRVQDIFHSHEKAKKDKDKDGQLPPEKNIDLNAAGILRGIDDQ